MQRSDLAVVQPEERSLLNDTHLRVVSLDPLTDSRWERLSEQFASSVFHSPAWIRVLVDTYGFKVQAVVLLDEADQPKAGLVFCRVADMLGDRIVSLPFSDYCDPLVGEYHDWKYLFKKLAAERCPILVRLLHNHLPLQDPDLVVIKRAKWHGLDVRPDLDILWRRLHPSRRRGINRAQRDGAVVRRAETQQDLRAFFDMHLMLRKNKYRLLAQPLHFFEQVWRHFIDQQRGILLLVDCQGRTIASMILLEWKNTLYCKFSASLADGLMHRPMDLLFWEAVQFAKARGLCSLDFGLSDLNQAGLISFKRDFGPEEKSISFVCYSRNQDPTPPQHQSRELLGRLTALFTDPSVPDAITKLAGDNLYRFFA